MKIIKLFCAAGMSTSMLVKKMQEAAAAQGLDVQISAHPETTIESESDHCDIALLGPQVGYKLPTAKKICEPKQVKIAVIPMVDYGMMNGERVLAFAFSL